MKMEKHSQEDIAQFLKKSELVVIKVGTSTLTHSNGKLNLNRMEQLTRQVADMSNAGRHVILVTSAAVGAGMGKMGLAQKPAVIAQKQALASIGQGLLMQVYEKIFAEYGIIVSQILLTREDFSHRERYLNARNTLYALFHYGVVPIINENDTIAFDEIKLGDNDTLAGLVAGLVGADLLVLLSDIDGLYTADPRKNPDATLIPVVEELTDEIIAAGGSAGSSLGTGGMYTKLAAARIAGNQGIPMVLMNGDHPADLQSLWQGHCPGTIFLPKEHKLVGRKGWLAFGARPQGALYLDKGAERALRQKGSSLLPSGILKVTGNFHRGDIVSIMGATEEIARGYVNYNAQDVATIMGHHSSEIPTLLEHAFEDEVIHRNNLSLRV
jgi:glutamate 5-kinase